MDSKEEDFIPEENCSYSKQDYWEQRFEKEGSYDWLTNYDGIKELLGKYINKTDKILMVGCGNSTVSQSMYEDGYKNIVNIDFAHSVIEAMREMHPHMEWIEMDMTDMSSFPDESFDVVLDKCAMDALVARQKDPWTPEPDLLEDIDQYLKHVQRITRKTGTFLQITFSQEHFRRPLLEDPSRYPWNISVDTFGGGFGYFMYIMKL